MTSKGKRPLRTLAPVDKVKAIQRIHDGESKASVARDIGVPESTLRGWCKNEEKLRYMARQLVPDKMAADSVNDKMIQRTGAAENGFLGPPEKRQKIESSLPINFSNKNNYEDLTYKRNPLSGLNFSSNKDIPQIDCNGLKPNFNTVYKNFDFATAFMANSKNKAFGNPDLSRPLEPTTAAISPFTNMSQLNGVSDFSKSPLAISFNELTANLNLIAQLNPSLAAMASLNTIGTNMKPTSNSPQNEKETPSSSILSVKDWAKQEPFQPFPLLPQPTTQQTQQDRKDTINSIDKSNNSNLNPDNKNKIESNFSSFLPSFSADGHLKDPLLFWLKSQQAMLGLNNLYTSSNNPQSNPLARSSTPQHHSTNETPNPAQLVFTAPENALSPSSSDAQEDAKNSAWLNWCKGLGTNFASLTKTTDCKIAAEKINVSPSKPILSVEEKHLDSHIKNEAEIAIPQSYQYNDQNDLPEDLSAKPAKRRNSETFEPSKVIKSEADTVTKTRETLDNLFYKLNSDSRESAATYDSDNLNKTIQNNNNDDDKTDHEEEKDEKYSITKYDNDNDNNNNINNNNNDDADDVNEALEHGEKFLKWLENCSNQRLKTVQILKLRLLIKKIFELD